MIICGYSNIDLLNPKKHKLTEDFINTMYGMGLYPTITRLSINTCHSTTLIHNTNIMDNNIDNGLLYSDISYHLPVFIVYHCKNRNPKEKKLL